LALIVAIRWWPGPRRQRTSGSGERRRRQGRI